MPFGVHLIYGLVKLVDQVSSHDRKILIKICSLNPVLVTRSLSLILFSGYRYLPDVDEASCRASCLLEETCVAVQFYVDTTGCKFLDTAMRLTAIESKTSKIVVFLPRLQRQRKNFILHDLKVKAADQARESINANITACNVSCSQDAFCGAFVMCQRAQGSWCATSKNCLLYSKQQVSSVEIDKNSEMHFVWKDYAQVTGNSLTGQKNVG